MNALSRNGTEGRVYGGDCELVHIPDGQRKEVGAMAADTIEFQMRDRAFAVGKNSEGTLCPGCYMVALFDAAVTLAQRNGQSLTELAATMGLAFAKLAANPGSGLTEEIEVILDPEDNVGA